MADNSDTGNPRSRSQPPPSSRTGANRSETGAATNSGPAGREILMVRFIRLCSAVLAAPTAREAAALMVNRISEIVRVDRAVLVRLDGKHAILSVTGGGAVAQDTAFADAVETIRDVHKDKQNPEVMPFQEIGKYSDSLGKVSRAMGGTSVLWLPLWLSTNGRILPEYALWLERWHGRPWEQTDVELLRQAALFMGRALVRPPKAVMQPVRRWKRTIIMGVIFVFLALPITSTVTAPLQVVPDRPHHVFAPMDGILKQLFVQPGQRVKTEDVLFKYDARVLDKRLDEAYRNVAVARAKLARLQGAAHRDPQARAEVPVQQLEVERAEADVKFFAKQRDRAEVRAGKSGVVVLDDPDALIGAALQTGQGVLSVADPDSTKLKIMVPASDVGFLKKGARVKVRLDSDPLKTLPAIITRIGFEIKLSQEMVPSVLTEAVWSEQIKEVRPGQRGTAKIFGSTTCLGIQILRKPLIRIRSLIGL